MTSPRSASSSGRVVVSEVDGGSARYAIRSPAGSSIVGSTSCTPSLEEEGEEEALVDTCHAWKLDATFRTGGFVAFVGGRPADAADAAAGMPSPYATSATTSAARGAGRTGGAPSSATTKAAPGAARSTLTFASKLVMAGNSRCSGSGPVARAVRTKSGGHARIRLLRRRCTGQAQQLAKDARSSTTIISAYVVSGSSRRSSRVVVALMTSRASTLATP